MNSSTQVPAAPREQSLGGPVALATVQVLAGVLCHSLILNIEFERNMYKLFRAYLFTVAAFFALSRFQSENGGVEAIRLVASFTALSACGFMGAMSIYRMFFHRLNGIPGPFWARLSKWHSVGLARRNLQFHREVFKLHEKYGDIVRTGPREVSILRADAVPLVFNPKSSCQKSTWHTHSVVDTEVSHLMEMRNPVEYRYRRRVYDRALNASSLEMYEPRVSKLADLLVYQVRQSIDSPISISKWSMLYTFDVMGETAFSESYGNLASGTENEVIRDLHIAMQFVGWINQVPWVARLISAVSFGMLSTMQFDKWCTARIKEKQKRYDPSEPPKDITSFLLKAIDDGERGGPFTQTALERDAGLIAIAGSDTSASTFIYAIYFLATNPTIMAKLRAEINTALASEPNPGAWSYDKVKNLSFLENVILETLRMRPAVPTGTTRETPKGGIIIGGRHIPENVNVMLPIMPIQTSEKFCPRAGEFLPERWNEPGAEKEIPFLPFGGGTFRCPGRNLAIMSMKIVISKMIREFEIELPRDFDRKAFETDEKDYFTLFPPELRVNLKEREL